MTVLMAVPAAEGECCARPEQSVRSSRGQAMLLPEVNWNLHSSFFFQSQ